MDTQTEQLYGDRLSGAITLDTFMMLSKTVDEKRCAIQAEYDRLSKAVNAVQDQLQDIDRWHERIRSCLRLGAFDYDSLHNLIERIEVSEAEGRGNNRRQTVKIIYRFVGFMG